MTMQRRWLLACALAALAPRLALAEERWPAKPVRIVVSFQAGIDASLYPKLPYDPVKDFAPITLVAGAPNVLVMNPAKAKAIGVESVADLIRYAKANPGKLNMGRLRPTCVQTLRSH